MLAYPILLGGAPDNFSKTLIAGIYGIVVALFGFFGFFSTKAAISLWREDLNLCSSYVPLISGYQKPPPSKHGYILIAISNLLASVGIIAFLSIYLVRTAPVMKTANLHLNASSSPFPQHRSSDFGGLQWDGKTGNMLVSIKNSGQVAAENFNLILRFNVSMSAVVQLSTLPDVRSELSWDGAPVSGLGIILQDKSNRRFLEHGNLVSPAVRISGRRLDPGDTVRFVVAIDPMYGERLARLNQQPALVKAAGTYEFRDGDSAREEKQLSYPRDPRGGDNAPQ